MSKRNPEKAIQMLDMLLEFFDGGRRWTRNTLYDASSRHRCLIGAMYYVRRQWGIRGAGTELYLRDALPSMHKKPLDQIADPFTALLYTHCEPYKPDNKDLMAYNDGSSYNEVRELIVEARALAQAELDRRRKPAVKPRAKRGVSEFKNFESTCAKHARSASAPRRHSRRGQE